MVFRFTSIVALYLVLRDLKVLEQSKLSECGKVNVTEEQIQGWVESALKDLLEKDKALFEFKVSERAVTHRLAMYLGMVIEPKLSSISVDCEYNRHYGDPKKFPRAKLENNLDCLLDKNESWHNIALDCIGNSNIESNVEKAKCNIAADLRAGARRVIPDIVVHCRGNDNNNVLIVEVKVAQSKHQAVLLDLAKLKTFTDNGSKVKYQYGLFINIEEPEMSRIKAWFFVFENGKSERKSWTFVQAEPKTENK